LLGPGPSDRQVIALTRSADCVIVTRFNLPSAGVESLIRAQEGWLRNRIELFERYCVPSVSAQTNRAFRWIIYLDPQSPQWLLDRLEPLIAANVFTPIYREQVDEPDLIADIKETAGDEKVDDLITINLDNDDGLAADFIDRVRSVPAAGANVAIYFEYGLIRTPSRLYLRRDQTNAFASVRGPWDSARTCWADWHNLLGKHMQVRVVGGRPAWLQVVHGQNVSNRVRGRLVAVSGYRTAFTGALDDLSDPPASERLTDLLVARPLRFARESARALVKKAAMRVLGKSGWDRAKHALRTARGYVKR
jgi:Putative rhamnosyl transferase